MIRQIVVTAVVAFLMVPAAARRPTQSVGLITPRRTSRGTR